MLNTPESLLVSSMVQPNRYTTIHFGVIIQCTNFGLMCFDWPFLMSFVLILCAIRIGQISYACVWSERNNRMNPPSLRTRGSTSFLSPTEAKLVLWDMSLAVFCKHRTFLPTDILVEHGQ